jgi:NAD(P)-dependent dehydrogenase (short-subunit alcohol dehydrogenase family)
VIERVVVTGAAGAVGAACVKAFQDRGAEVIGIDIRPSSGADVHLTSDVADAECGRQVLEQLGDRWVDVLVNNAAIGHNQPAVGTSSERFDEIIAVNLRAPFLLSTALYPKLRERSGVVVNVSSVHAFATSSPVSVYAASKGGLVALTRALALEWGPEVQVNCVVPGAVDSPLLEEGLARAGKTLKAFGERLAVGRVGRPDEIADAVVFLSTNPYVSGTALVVDGGAMARLSTE